MYTPTLKGVKVQASGIFLKIITELKKKITLKYKTVTNGVRGNSVASSIFRVLYTHLHCPFLELLIIPNKLCTYWTITSPLRPPPTAVVTSILLSTSMNLITLGTPYKWKYTVMCFFDWLIHLTKMNVACVRFWFLLKAEEYSTYTHTPLVLSFAFPNC